MSDVIRFQPEEHLEAVKDLFKAAAGEAYKDFEPRPADRVIKEEYVAVRAGEVVGFGMMGDVTEEFAQHWGLNNPDEKMQQLLASAAVNLASDAETEASIEQDQRPGSRPNDERQIQLTDLELEGAIDIGLTFVSASIGPEERSDTWYALFHKRLIRAYHLKRPAVVGAWSELTTLNEKLRSEGGALIVQRPHHDRVANL